jgi:hypothetical protein
MAVPNRESPTELLEAINVMPIFDALVLPQRREGAVEERCRGPSRRRYSSENVVVTEPTRRELKPPYFKRHHGQE